MSTLSQFFGGSGADSACAAMSIVNGATAITGTPQINFDNATVDSRFSVRAAIPGGVQADICTFFNVTEGSGIFIQNANKAISATKQNLLRFLGSGNVNIDRTVDIDALGFVLQGGATHTINNGSNPALVRIGNLSIFKTNNSAYTFNAFVNYPTLTTIEEFNYLNPYQATTFTLNFTGCGLNAASVENILVGLNNGSRTGTSSQTVNLSGGTSAGLSSLSSAAAAARTGLISKGWTVTLNA